jgi:large subunit ribosomal protein L29
MKSKEFAEMKQKTIAELNTDLNKKKSELFNLRFQLATGQLQNTAAISACKRDIARVKTILSLRENEKQA